MYGDNASQLVELVEDLIEHMNLPDTASAGRLALSILERWKDYANLWQEQEQANPQSQVTPLAKCLLESEPWQHSFV